MSLRFLLLGLGVVLAARPVAAQPTVVLAEPPSAARVATAPLRAEYVDHFTRVPAVAVPERLRGRGGATFEVDYVDFPPEPRAAFERAVELWSQLLQSPVPIRVRATWEADADEDILGSAFPRIIANFEFAPRLDTWYVSALADAFIGEEQDPDEYDIEASFNSAFEHWYFGLDAAPPAGTFDFVSVALHELAHGLGFVGSMFVEGGEGLWGFEAGGANRPFPVVYDRFADCGEIPLLDSSVFPNPSEELADALTSQAVFFTGPAAAAAEPRGVPPLHAPRPWVTGSSYSHLSELEIGGVEFYPPGEPNSLMTPFLGGAEGIHSPGAVTCGLLRDTGWEMGPACLALLEEAGDSGPAGAPAVACELDGPVLPDFEARQQCDAFTDEPVCGPYPNPVSAVGGVDVSLLVALEVEDPVRVALYDAVGRRVRAFERTPEAGKLTVSVAGFPSGVYFIHVEGGGIDETRPLTVLR